MIVPARALQEVSRISADADPEKRVALTVAEGRNQVLFRIIGLYGARRLSLVTYLMPGFALVYGALLLGEPVTAAALGGLALILAGVALGSGALGDRLRRRGATR